MTNSSPNQKTLTDLYILCYMEKVFYFCLKKTGDRREAEDLAQDISLNVLVQLKKGNQPRDFSAWVWAIARNCYSRWAAKRRIISERLAPEDILEYEQPDPDYAFDGLIKSEELSLLRRELAFISSNYRDVMVAYYIEDRSASEIAKRLRISVDAVKKRLSRGRKILKEGMDMAREFGKMSYKPEDIAFIKDGSDGSGGEPWTIVEHLMNKNILLAAHRNPSTAEDLAMELGIALPYMEDELERLVNETLLIKNGDKYEANLPIISAATQRKVYDNQWSIAPKLTDKIIELVEQEKRAYDSKDYYNEGYQSFDDAKWALLTIYADFIRTVVESAVSDECRSSGKNSGGAEGIGDIDKFGRTIRPKGGRWDLVGMEDMGAESNRPGFIGWHNCPFSDEEIKNGRNYSFQEYKYCGIGINQKTPEFLSSAEGSALNLIARGRAAEADKDAVDRLAGWGYLKKDGDSYVPTFLITDVDRLPKRTPQEAAEAEKTLNEAIEIVKPSYMFCKGLITAEISESIMNRNHQIGKVALMIYSLRGIVISEALKQGYLRYDPNEEGRMLGTYMTLYDKPYKSEEFDTQFPPKQEHI